MKKKVLLIDESLTVQKVVALTLDKNRFQLSFAKSRSEVMKAVLENPPDLILLSDQVQDFQSGNFPKEMETWLGGVREAAPVVLVTAQDIKESRHYAGVLRKPFAPQALQELVEELVSQNELSEVHPAEEDEARLQRIFNDTFADESTLVKETFRQEVDATEPTAFHSADPWKQAPATSLWNVDDDQKKAATPIAVSNAPVGQILTEAQVEKMLSNTQLDAMVDKILSKVVPPLVEKLVNERLDKLLKEQEQFLDLKP